ACANTSVPEALSQGHSSSGCEDRVESKTVGEARLGYPIKQMITMYGEDGRPNVIAIEVLDLSKATLDAALFEIPADYKEAKDYRELAGIKTTTGVPSVDGAPGVGELPGKLPGAREEESAPIAIEPKKPGTTRIGVVAINNKTDRRVGLG